MKHYWEDYEQFEALHAEILEALESDNDQKIVELLDEVHYVDVAEIMMELEEGHRNKFFSLLTRVQAAAVFSEIDSETFEVLFQLLSKQQKTAILELMDQDDIVDLLGEISESLKQRILALLSAEDAAEVRELMVYHEDTAGGIMTKDFVDIKRMMTVAESIEFLRANAPAAETIYYIYVTDDADHLVGIISLRELIIANSDVIIDSIMSSRVISVQVDADQEEVARVVKKYDLLAVPVVDPDDRLLGIITVDDVMDVIEEETTEDFLKFAGTSEVDFEDYDNSILSGILYSVRSRLPWLIVTVFGGLLTAFIISGFEKALSTDQTIALFMPLLAGMGGNVGTQSSTLTVRNIALNDIRGKEVLRTIMQEIVVGFSVGLVCASMVAVLSFMMKGRLMLSLIVGLSMWANMITAATIGTAVPLFFKRVGIDPAVASAPFITTTIDITGLSIYFTLATIMMQQFL